MFDEFIGFPALVDFLRLLLDVFLIFADFFQLYLSHLEFELLVLLDFFVLEHFSQDFVAELFFAEFLQLGFNLEDFRWKIQVGDYFTASCETVF